MRTDVNISNEMITHTEYITALKVFNIESLRQSSTRKCGSKETLFCWYVDNEDRKTNVKLTMIIILSKTGTSMQIMTKSELHYERQGTALLFPSCLYHQSVYVEDHTMKLCFILEDTKEIISPELSARTTRGQRVR